MKYLTIYIMMIAAQGSCDFLTLSESDARGRLGVHSSPPSSPSKWIRRILPTEALSSQASNIVKNAKVQNFTPQQIVAITILAEARGEGERGMYAVACVIAQRAIDGKTRPDLVCIAPAQFSCWNPADPQYKRLSKLLAIPESDYALKLVDKLSKLKRSYVGYANHYHTHTVAPSWSRGKAPVKIIGGHRFFKL